MTQTNIISAATCREPANIDRDIKSAVKRTKFSGLKRNIDFLKKASQISKP